MASGSRSKVEVVGSTPLTCNAYCSATMLETNDVKAVVRYDGQLDAAGNCVVEAVDLINIRPHPGFDLMKLAVCDTVDVMHKGVWWKAEIVAEHDSLFGLFLRYLPVGSQYIVYHKYDVRAHRIWSNTGGSNRLFIPKVVKFPLEIRELVEVTGSGKHACNAFYKVVLLEYHGEKASVRYEDRFDMHGSLLVDEVPVINVRPDPGYLLIDYSVGDVVNVNVKGGWWRASVASIHGSFFCLFFSYFPIGSQYLKFHKSDLRMDVTWVSTDEGCGWVAWKV